MCKFKALLVLIALSLSVSSFAQGGGDRAGGGGYPFSYSGEAIYTMFKSEKLWRQLGGEIESVIRKSSEGRVSVYAITTTESVGIIDDRGRTTGWLRKPCMVVVTMENVEINEFESEQTVKDVDFSACPERMGSKRR